MYKCIFLLFDGARPDLLQELAFNGKLPNIKKYFYDEGGSATATTVFPSTTGPAYLPFLTGRFPGACNIPGIRWLDRENFEQNPKSNRGRRSYVGPENTLFNSDLSPDIQTIYDRIQPAFSINSIVTRGLPRVPASQSLAQQLLMFYAKLSHHWNPVDNFAKRHLFRALENKFKFSFISFLSIDEHSHLSHPFSQASIDTYQQLDIIVGEVFSTLEKKGERDTTLVVISSDHGLTATDKHMELWRWFETRGRRVFFYPNIFRTNVDAACMVSGNAMAHMYLKNGPSWVPYSYYKDIKSTGQLDELLLEPAIDQLFLRSSQGGCIALSARGSAHIQKNGDQLHYKVLTKDPFGFGPLPTKMNFQEALEKTFHTDYPDAILQAIQIFDSPRTGDIVVTSKVGYDLRKMFEIPPHHGSHGSLHREHMLVPLLTSLPVLESKKPHRTIDIFPKILDFLQ